MAQATKTDAKVRGADSIRQWWLECLAEGEILSGVPAYDFRHELKRWESNPIRLPTKLVHDAYAEWAKKNSRRVEHSISLGNQLNELAAATIVRPPTSQDPGRRRAYDLPSLRDCRKRWDAKTRDVWGWDDEDLDDVAGVQVSDIQVQGSASVLLSDQDLVAVNRQSPNPMEIRAA